MCYKSPAPRCSKHAREALRAAWKHLVAADRVLKQAKDDYEEKRDKATAAKLRAAEFEFKKADAAAVKAKKAYDKAAEEKRAAYKAHKKAQSEYAMSPEGIRKLRERGDHEQADASSAERDRRMKLAREQNAPVEKRSPLANAVLDAGNDADRRKAMRELKASGDETAMKQVLAATDSEEEVHSIAMSALSPKVESTGLLAAAIKSKALTPVELHQLFTRISSRESNAQRDIYNGKEAWAPLSQPEVLEAFKQRAEDHDEVYFRGSTEIGNPRLMGGTSLRGLLAEHEHRAAIRPTITALQRIGGSEWEKGDQHRVYLDFTDAVEAAGGKATLDYRDEAKSLVIDGREMAVPRRWKPAGVYYDVKAQRWELTGSEEIDSLLSPALSEVTKK